MKPSASPPSGYPPLDEPPSGARKLGPWLVGVAVIVVLVVVLVIANQKTPPPPTAGNVPAAAGTPAAPSTGASNSPMTASSPATGNVAVAPGNLPAGNTAAANAPASKAAAPNAPGSSAKPNSTTGVKPARPPINPNDLPPGHPAITTDEATQVGIQWLGYSCFYIDSPGGVAVVTDPFDPSSTGLKPPGTGAHLITVSDAEPTHDYTKVVHPFKNQQGDVQPQRVIHGTSAEQGDVKITPVPTGSGNFAYIIQSGALRIVHLGDLRHPLTPAQIKSLGAVDILMVPAGGTGLSSKEAADLTKAIAPRIVMPMAYRTPDAEGPMTKLKPLEKFLSGTPYAVTAKDTDVTMISKADLPANTEVYTFRLQH